MSFGSRIRKLAGETAVYGVATIVGRFVNFLLIPLYTNVFPPGEYGVISLLYAWIAVLVILYLYGLESAFFRFASKLENLDERTSFSTPALTLTLTAGVTSLLLALFAEPVAAFVELGPHALLVRYAAAILFFDTLAALPFAWLRLNSRPGTFALVKLVNIGINVVLNLVLILHLGFGIEAIPLSGLVASCLTLLLLTPIYEAKLRPRFSWSLLKSMLAYGLPLVPTGLCAQVIAVADRQILTLLTDKDTVGIYNANHKLGIFMMLVVLMFQYAWQPFYLERARDPDAPALFARVLTYFVLVACAVLVTLTLFIEDLVIHLSIAGRHVIGEPYWAGLAIVPVVLGAYIFYGIYINLSAGPSITKQTGWLAGAAGLGAFVSIAANVILIPRIGMMGSAWAQLAAYLVMALVLYRVSLRIYPVPWEWGRLARIGLATGAALLAAWLGPASLSWRLAALVLFPLLLVLSGFFAPGERGRIKALWGAIRRGS